MSVIIIEGVLFVVSLATGAALLYLVRAILTAAEAQVRDHELLSRGITGTLMQYESQSYR